MTIETTIPKAQPQRNGSENGVAPAMESPPIDPKNLDAIRLLDAWDEATEEEIQEQRETWAFLERVLDEDRLSPERKLFPK